MVRYPCRFRIRASLFTVSGRSHRDGPPPETGANLADDQQWLRTICDAYGILLVLDEVITGWGRMDANIGAQASGVTPDLMTLAETITNGAQSMGAGCWPRGRASAIAPTPRKLLLGFVVPTRDPAEAQSQTPQPQPLTLA